VLARLDPAAFARQEQLPAPPGIGLLDDAEGAALAPLLATALRAWRAGDHAAAARAFGQRLDEDADDVAALVGQGIALVALGDHEAALRRLDADAQALPAALAADPPAACAREVALGVALRHLGRLRAAEARYRACLAIDPGHAVAWRDLGVLQELYLQDAAAALETYRRAAAAAPSDGELAGWIARLEAANVVSRTP
jgi:tetratricopeptide (TPR) repeat protein